MSGNNNSKSAIGKGGNYNSSYLDAKSFDPSIGITKSESEKSVTLPPINYCETTEQFLSDALASIEDGDRVSVEIVKKGRLTNRIDLSKGISKTEISYEKSFINWQSVVVVMVVAIPWFFGAEKIVSSIGKNMGNVFNK